MDLKGKSMAYKARKQAVDVENMEESCHHFHTMLIDRSYMIVILEVILLMH
jgi:hypothetical protein